MEELVRVEEEYTRQRDNLLGLVTNLQRQQRLKEYFACTLHRQSKGDLEKKLPLGEYIRNRLIAEGDFIDLAEARKCFLDKEYESSRPYSGEPCWQIGVSGDITSRESIVVAGGVSPRLKPISQITENDSVQGMVELQIPKLKEGSEEYMTQPVVSKILDQSSEQNLYLIPPLEIMEKKDFETEISEHQGQKSNQGKSKLDLDDPQEIISSDSESDTGCEKDLELELFSNNVVEKEDFTLSVNSFENRQLTSLSVFDSDSVIFSTDQNEIILFDTLSKETKTLTKESIIGASESSVIQAALSYESPSSFQSIFSEQNLFPISNVIVDCNHCIYFTYRGYFFQNLEPGKSELLFKKMGDGLEKTSFDPKYGVKLNFAKDTLLFKRMNQDENDSQDSNRVITCTLTPNLILKEYQLEAGLLIDFKLMNNSLFYMMLHQEKPINHYKLYTSGQEEPIKVKNIKNYQYCSFDVTQDLQLIVFGAFKPQPESNLQVSSDLTEYSVPGEEKPCEPLVENMITMELDMDIWPDNSSSNSTPSSTSSHMQPGSQTSVEPLSSAHTVFFSSRGQLKTVENLQIKTDKKKKSIFTVCTTVNPAGVHILKSVVAINRQVILSSVWVYTDEGHSPSLFTVRPSMFANGLALLYDNKCISINFKKKRGKETTKKIVEKDN